MPTIFASEHPERRQPEPVAEPIQPTDHAVASIEKLMHSPNSSMGFFATYSTRPKGVNFANQEPDEVILLFVRRHFITNVPWLLLTFLLLLLPPVILLLFSLFPSLILPLGLVSILVGFFYLIVTGYAFGKFISWFYNIGVVTQKRIMDLDSTNILAHNAATANFNEIVDVKFAQRGFFQSTFDYGDIHIQTEALRANFEFDACPKPTEVTDVISDLRVHSTKGHPHGHS